MSAFLGRGLLARCESLLDSRERRSLVIGDEGPRTLSETQRKGRCNHFCRTCLATERLPGTAYCTQKERAGAFSHSL